MFELDKDSYIYEGMASESDEEIFITQNKFCGVSSPSWELKDILGVKIKVSITKEKMRQLRKRILQKGELSS